MNGKDYIEKLLVVGCAALSLIPFAGILLSIAVGIAFGAQWGFALAAVLVVAVALYVISLIGGPNE